MAFPYAYPCRTTPAEPPDSVAHLEAAIRRLDRNHRQRLAMRLNKLAKKYKNGTLVRAC